MSLFDTVNDFKNFKNNPQKTGQLHSSLLGLKQKVVVLIPGDQNVITRWRLLKLNLGLIWSYNAPDQVIIGSYLSLLTLFSDQPGQMLRSMTNDPDIEAQLLEVISGVDDKIHFSSRGMDMTDQENAYYLMSQSGPEKSVSWIPFINEKVVEMRITSTGKFQEVLSSVLLQVWVLLSKAVTAPDTARDSEQRRWVKYLQQRRVKLEYKLKNKWLDIARDNMAEYISIRRLMVEILIEINKASGTKSRIVEMIADVGNYIAETGMAGFFLTIKYGLETRYPTLALNEFQGDLTTLQQLMKLYKDQGEKAPYLVLLEDSIQTRFAPGNYPLLWSYAMGIGTTLDRSMNNLNFNRSYLEPLFFKLGQDTVIKLEGNIDNKLAKELNLNDQQIQALKEVVKPDLTSQSQTGLRGRTSHFTIEPIEIESKEKISTEESDSEEEYITPYQRIKKNMRKQGIDMSTEQPNATRDSDAKASTSILEDLRRKFADKVSSQDNKKLTSQKKDSSNSSGEDNSGTSDLEVVNNL
ncbi:nucleocapsid protein [Parajeilongvirus diaemi]|nr:nucleocapsid protein [Diaemus bat paramyxovirus]